MKSSSVVVRIGKRLVKAIAKQAVSNPVQARLVTWMARSGDGTDASLRQGSLPLPVHFYSPVPDVPISNGEKSGIERANCPVLTFARAPNSSTA